MKAHFRSVVERTLCKHEPKWKSLGRAAQPVLALTYVPSDVNTVGHNQANVCLYSGEDLMHTNDYIKLYIGLN